MLFILAAHSFLFLDSTHLHNLLSVFMNSGCSNFLLTFGVISLLSFSHSGV